VVLRIINTRNFFSISTHAYQHILSNCLKFKRVLLKIMWGLHIIYYEPFDFQQILKVCVDSGVLKTRDYVYNTHDFRRKRV